MKIAIIADEVTQDVLWALDLIVEWDLDTVELRTAWGKNLVDLESAASARLESLVRSRDLAVSAIASPFLKCWLDSSRRPAPGDAFFFRAVQAIVDGIAHIFNARPRSIRPAENATTSPMPSARASCIIERNGGFNERSAFIEKGGWDKMPGEQKPSFDVSRACADGLEYLTK